MSSPVPPPKRLDFTVPEAPKPARRRPRGSYIMGARSFRAFNDKLGEEGRRERARKGAEGRWNK